VCDAGCHAVVTHIVSVFGAVLQVRERERERCVRSDRRAGPMVSYRCDQVVVDSFDCEP
jgi:hypothetical protein